MLQKLNVKDILVQSILFKLFVFKRNGSCTSLRIIDIIFSGDFLRCSVIQPVYNCPFHIDIYDL